MINSHLDYCFEQEERRQQPIEVTPDIIEDEDDFVTSQRRLPAKSPVKTRSKRRQMAKQS